jgi:Protein tyrosine and serine/threonine kinase
MPAADKGKVIDAIWRLLLPWKVDPSRVRCNLRNEIGVGDYGRVYKGKLDESAVAVKVVAADLVAGSDFLRDDFMREATLMTELRHPVHRGVSGCVLATRRDSAVHLFPR